jgi:hypothetical protein
MRPSGHLELLSLRAEGLLLARGTWELHALAGLDAAAGFPLAEAGQALEADVEEEHDDGDDGVGGVEAPGRAGELQSEPAVDNTEHHEDASVDDVGVRDGAAGLVLDVVRVVQHAEHRLQQHEATDHGAEDCVGRGEVLLSVSERVRIELGGSRCEGRGESGRGERTIKVFCETTMPMPKPTHMRMKVTICQTACRIHLPMRGMRMDPSGYRITKTMLMMRP